MDPRIEFDPGSGVLIEWPDGHQSSYRTDRLRRLCPCAACRQEADPGDPLRIVEPPAPEATRLVRIERVGNYGLTLIWGDGHSTGIYSWELLRDHCECFACRTAKQGRPS